MPVTYEIDRSKGLIRTHCTGRVSLPDVLDHFATLEHDPDRPPRLDVLLDWTGLESLPATDQVKLVVQRMDWRSSIDFGCCAVVADTDVLYGMARVFLAYADNHFDDADVFRSRAEAERWLNQRTRAGT